MNSLSCYSSDPPVVHLYHASVPCKLFAERSGTARTRAKPSWPRGEIHAHVYYTVPDHSRFPTCRKSAHMFANGDLRTSGRYRPRCPHEGAPDPPGQRFQLDRGTSHGNVKHDYSRTDNTCNNNRISRPTAGLKAAGDLVLLMNPWIMVYVPVALSLVWC